MSVSVDERPRRRSSKAVGPVVVGVGEFSRWLVSDGEPRLRRTLLGRRVDLTGWNANVIHLAPL